MWPPTPGLAAICLAVAIALASGATWSVQQWRWGAKYSQLEKDQATDRADRADRYRDALARAVQDTQEANDARELELAQIAAAAGSRADAVIRVCKPAAVRARPGDQVPDAQHAAGTAAGVLPGEGQPAPGPDGVTEYSTRELHQLFDEADAVSADLRICQARWPK